MSSLIDLDALSIYPEKEFYGIRNLITDDQLQAAIQDGDSSGLVLDLTGIETLLDGSEIDPSKIYGKVYTGPFPFESEETEYNYKRYRRVNDISEGQGIIDTNTLLRDKYNSEKWTDRGTVAVRVTLFLEQEGQDRILGTYDTYTAFLFDDQTTQKLASFKEAPSVNLINSDDPTTMVIAFETATPEPATITIEGVGTVTSEAQTKHEVVIDGLMPDTEYTYTVTIGEGETIVDFYPESTFTTAPEAGEYPDDGSIVTVFMSDSREGEPAEGMQAFMGVNAATLERGLNLGFQKGGDVFVFGGDLINGYTTSPEDYEMQFNAYKQTVAGWHASKPIYTAMGNHESLLRNYDDGSSRGISIDRFDENGSYDTESSESVFADEFVNPTNAPDTELPERPSYEENVYSFQYGTIKYIAFNNNYWVSYASSEVGGNPEGYMFQDQLTWIEQELEAAEADDTVDYVILYAQEPVFPNGGHVGDAMWYNGNNNVRAYTYNGTELVPAEKGILEVRDQFATLLSDYDKVAGVFTGDEHGYSRVLIDDTVPIGDITKDDTNGDGVISVDEGFSSLSSLENPVWYISAGGAGAPYYAQEFTPWGEYWGEQDNPVEGFLSSSQEHTVILEATEDGLKMEVYGIQGELIDSIEDLTAIKDGETTVTTPLPPSDDDGDNSNLPTFTYNPIVEDTPQNEPTSLAPPVNIDYLFDFPENDSYGIRNLLSTDQIQAAIKDGDENGLVLDLNGIRRLQDGRFINPNKIYGTVSVGPFPFESAETEYNSKRYRRTRDVENGQGLINTSYLLPDRTNSEGWEDSGTVTVRTTLYLERSGQDVFLGTYDTYTAFRLDEDNDQTLKLASFTEAPSVNLINSDDPTQMVIAFETAEAEMASVIVEGVGIFTSETAATNHEVVISGLDPDTEYEYTVTIGEGDRTVDFYPESSFTTAPEKGELSEDGFSFMFMSDSREGEPAESMQAFMGVNAETLERGVNLGYQKGADLFIFGGDLINGYTTSPEDYSVQFEAFKQVTAGWSASKPIYAAMGNHESLLRNYDDGSSRGIRIDRFDENGSYDTESSEAIFADEFINPTNAPETEVDTRPSYEENVYSFQHSTVKYIAFNNNYWVSYSSDTVGGSPEGYMFQDQLTWIKEELAAAEADDTVDYVILYAQEPVFPNGGHVADAMWYEGNNNVRAYTYDGENLIPEEKGILEVRDQFATMLSESSKVAAVLTGDEHGYSRTLVDDTVPIGDITQDDTNGDGVINPEDGESFSTLSGLENPVWYISAGGAGAPFYAEEFTPWQEYWNEQDDPLEGFKYSSQEHTVLFDVTEDGLSMEVYSIYGELIDKIDNLMDVKKPTVGISLDKTTVTEDFDTFNLTFTLDEAAPEGGLRVVWSEVDSDNEFGDLDFPPILTNASNLEQLTPEGDELARFAITIDEGATSATLTFSTIPDMITEGEETTLYTLIEDNDYQLDEANSSALLTIEDTSQDPPRFVSGTPDDDVFDAAFGDGGFVGKGQILLSGSGDDVVSVTDAVGGNNIRTGSGNDEIYAGTNNRIDAGSDDDLLFLGSGGGNNRVTGGSGLDMFFLTEDDSLLPANPNTIADFDADEGDLIGFLATSLTFESLGTDWNLTQDGVNTVIEAFGQEIAVLNRVNAASLTEANFIFA